MTLLPVIERELRAESRSAFTYWLRFFGAVALMAMGALFFSRRGLSNLGGTDLFQIFHRTLFVAVWIVAALMTADCISRERREGTLGLLFLTPLRPIEVVLAKGLAHGLRVVGVGLAAVPILVVPFLMGGVTWQQALASVLINFSALCWALAAGILASSCCQSLARALVVAAVLEAISFAFLLIVQGVALDATMPAKWGKQRDLLWLGYGALLHTGELVVWLLQLGGPAAASKWLAGLAVVSAVSLLGCLFAAALAAQNVRRTAQDKGPSVALQQVEKQFCTPKYGLALFRGWMRRILERNPVGWLERRTWQGRMVTWSWMAVMISLIIGAIGAGFSDRDLFLSWMLVLGWLLVASVGLTASGSLRRERETGVIELLLVSPLSVHQIIGGRLRGIGGQFLPAALLFFGSWIWLLQGFSTTLFAGNNGLETGLIWIWFFVVTLLTIPVVGLYFSLRCQMFFLAFFWTALLGLGVPWFVSSVLAEQIQRDLDTAIPPFWRSGFGMVLTWAALALSRRPVAASRGLSLALAASLGLVALLSFASCLDLGKWRDENGLLPLVMISSVLQIGIAVNLGVLLQRRLERREFSMPR